MCVFFAVGIDYTAVLEVKKKKVKEVSLPDNKQKKIDKSDIHDMQKFMEMYIQTKKKNKNDVIFVE